MEDVEKATVVSDNTMVRLGLVIALLAVLSGGGFASVWWASGVSSDINTIKTQLVRFNAMENLESRVKLLETVGSPQARDLQKQLDELRREFELHKATTASKGVP